MQHKSNEAIEANSKQEKRS